MDVSLMADMLKGTTVTVWRPVFGADQLDPDAATYAPETVENVLVAPTDTADAQESARPWATAATMTFHFPTAYAESLRGCRVEYAGHTYEVIGDPQPYMAELAPGTWNRPVRAMEVIG